MKIKSLLHFYLSETQRIYLPVAAVLLVLNIIFIVHSFNPIHSRSTTILNVAVGILFILFNVFGVLLLLPFMDAYPILHWIHAVLTTAFISIITANQPDHMLNISLIMIATTLIGTTVIAGRLPAYFLLIMVSIFRTFIYQNVDADQTFLFWMRVLALPLAGIVSIETIIMMRDSIAKEVFRLKTINQVAQSFSSSLELNQVITLVSHAIQNALKADTYYVAMLNGDNLHFELMYDDGEFFPPMDVSIKGSLAGHVIESRQPMLLQDLSKDITKMGIQYTVVGKPRISKSWMGVPLIANQKILGLIAVAAYKPAFFNEQDLEMLQSVALQASLAIVNACHHTEVEKQSRQDSLTGALNHGTFIQSLEQELTNPGCCNPSLALIMLDVDNFKHYNDKWGHLVGDQVLSELTRVIQSHVKKTDLVGRWGGEEFSIALLNVTLSQAMQVAERIRTSMNTVSLCMGENENIACPSVSQGIAIFPAEAQDAFALIDLADKRLYIAKKRGRNQIQSTGNGKSQALKPLKLTA